MPAENKDKISFPLIGLYLDIIYEFCIDLELLSVLCALTLSRIDQRGGCKNTPLKGQPSGREVGFDFNWSTWLVATLNHSCMTTYAIKTFFSLFPRPSHFIFISKFKIASCYQSRVERNARCGGGLSPFKPYSKLIIFYNIKKNKWLLTV